MRYEEISADTVWWQKKTPEEIANEKARWKRIADANRERSLSKKLNLKTKDK